MTRFLYVVAYVDSRENDLTMLHFKHDFVDARDEQNAYDVGFRAIVMEKYERRVNDYVVELPNAT